MKKCILASCPFIEKIGKKHQKQFTEFLEKKLALTSCYCDVGFV